MLEGDTVSSDTSSNTSSETNGLGDTRTDGRTYEECGLLPDQSSPNVTRATGTAEWVVKGDHQTKLCYYCGDPAGTLDHLESVTWSGSKHRKRSAGVPACQSCNVMLSDRRITDLDDRKVFIAARLHERYDVELAEPRVPTDELEGSLLAMVEAKHAQLDAIEDRIAWADGTFGHVRQNRWYAR